MAHSWKNRGARTKVLIRARMRAGSSWTDVCILNLSNRGMGLQAAEAPPRGSYIEVRRGPNVIVARVAWAKSHRFGVSCQDELRVEDLVSDDPVRATVMTDGRVERRAASRAPAVSHERNRLKARAMEFACLAALGGGAAVAAFGAVESVLAKPLSQVATVLGPSR